MGYRIAKRGRYYWLLGRVITEEGKDWEVL
jgi:hypothetical protein